MIGIPSGQSPSENTRCGLIKSDIISLFVFAADIRYQVNLFETISLAAFRQRCAFSSPHQGEFANPAYHTAFETFEYVDKFIDPGFVVTKSSYLHASYYLEK